MRLEVDKHVTRDISSISCLISTLCVNNDWHRRTWFALAILLFAFADWLAILEHLQYVIQYSIRFLVSCRIFLGFQALHSVLFHRLLAFLSCQFLFEGSLIIRFTFLAKTVNKVIS